MQFDSNRPIYLQILDSICEQILDGKLEPDGRILSVREYGAQLGVNPNTVQKTYRLLEDEGLIQSHAGAKSYMVLDEEKVRRIRRELLEGDARNIVSAMKQMGLSLDEASALLKKYWD